MNYKLLLKINGKLLMLEAAFMLLPVITALIYRESSGLSFLPVIALLLIIGIPLSRLNPRRTEMYAREGLAIVATSWILMSLAGALPFYISREIPVFIDAFFETASGFTTTGASILDDVETLSHSMLFWRSFTHWVGGMGVLVFILAIAPLAGSYTVNLMRAESPGPQVEKVTPKIGSTAKLLYLIYAFLTLLQFVLMCAGGMPVFDSLLTAFGTAGTGGFGVKNSSIADYSTYIQSVITVFMLLYGVNFSIYYMILLKKIKPVFKNEELRFYLGIVAVAIILITANVANRFETLYEAFHHSAFQVAAIISTTGFTTVNFNDWPSFSKSILVLLMLFGASAGSTGGGMKISRILIMLKFIGIEAVRLIHPRKVNTISIDGHKVEYEMLKNIFLYFLCYAGLLALSVLIISLDGYSFTTNVTATISALSNIGPYVDAINDAWNFSSFSLISKLVLTIDMIFGRLEILPVLILFVPDTWRRK
ncbi:MAG: TrkH family potassium uptake protein [Clostridia bacterium]|nr:TrkH family potassium uptake protein [Clostridia bacterium]